MQILSPLSFVVVDKLREMMEESETTISSFKEEQRQMYSWFFKKNKICISWVLLP